MLKALVMAGGHLDSQTCSGRRKGIKVMQKEVDLANSLVLHWVQEMVIQKAIALRRNRCVLLQKVRVEPMEKYIIYKILKIILFRLYHPT